MNRLKLWLYVLLLLGAGAGNLYFLTGWLTARSIAHIDRELRSAAALAEARGRLLGASAAAIADAAARSPAVVAALTDPAAAPLAPAEDAVEAARAAVKPDGARPVLVAVAGSQGAAARAGGAEGVSVTPPEALLAEAQAGRRSTAWMQLDGKAWMVAAAPAGRNGAVAVGFPLNGEFSKAVHSAAGVDVTAALDGKVVATTASGAVDPVELAAVQSTPSRRPVDVGRLGKVRAALDWPAPPMPLLFANPPAARALALPLEGAGAATLVLSQETAPRFSGLAAYQLLALVAMALFLLVGLLLGLFMSDEAAPRFPRELVTAADRIARGDFSARVPTLAGSAGRIAAALNRAAEAAEARGAATAPQAVESAPAPAEPTAASAPPVAPARPIEPLVSPLAPEEPSAASEPQVAPEPEQVEREDSFASLLAAAGEPAVTQPLFPPTSEPSAVLDAMRREEEGSVELERPSALEVEPAPSGASFQDEPAPDAAPLEAFWQREPEPPAEAVREAAEPAASAIAAAVQNAAIEPEELAADADEPHWQEVYADFLRMRGETGESVTVPYDRFRARLERNREQLKEKHGARTVRFQPYLKEGKVALRATPVK